jgi:hypothetical protein
MDAKFYELMDRAHKPWITINDIFNYFEPLRA